VAGRNNPVPAKMSTNNSPKAIYRWDRAARYSAYIFIVLAAFSGFYYVYAFGVNVFWWDEWDVMPVLFERYVAGTLTLAKLWEAHNEHCIFFPNLVILGLGVLTKGNTVAYMYFTQVMLLTILAIFILAFRKQFTSGPAIWLMVPVAFLVFSLRQHENMLWGFQIAFAMVVASSLGVFLGLSLISNKRYMPMFVGSVLSATLATFSSLPGLIVWPIGLGQLLIVPLAKRPKVFLITAWTIIGSGEWFLYFQNWNKPKNNPMFDVSYLLTVIGSSLFWSETTALVAGILVLALTMSAVIIVLIRRQWAVQSFWLATAAFVLATLAAITIGRSSYGTIQAIQSRYTTISIPLVVATYVMLASQSGKKLTGICISLLFLTLLGLTIFSAGTSFFYGLDQGTLKRELRQWHQLVVCTIDSQPDDMIKSYPRSDVPRMQTAVLKKIKYSVFADPELCAHCQLPNPSLPVLSTATRYEIYGFIARGDFVSINGWAVDWPAQDLAGGVAVVIDGVAYPTRYGLRDDKASKTLNSEKFLLSGFNCITSVKALGEGKHEISLKVLSRDGKAVYNVD
jgi:hypothetical protein